MVDDPIQLAAATWFLAQEKSQTALQRMDPQLRAKVLAAFAGFIILGFGLIALTWLGARVTRRYMNQEAPRRRDLAQLQDDWADKPLPTPDSADDED